MKKIRIGLVGLGGIAGIHIASYKRIESVELVAAADALGKEARSYPMIADSNVTVYSSYKEMIEKEELDAIDICAPSSMHREISVYALESGLHVLCEKPMATSADDADAVALAAKKSGKIFMCAQIIRFAKPYAYLRDTVKSGELGKPVQLFMKRLSTVPTWRLANMGQDAKDNGGVMLDLSIHDVDFVYSVFGEPDSINGAYLATGSGNVSDCFNANLIYKGCSVNVSGAFYECEIPFQVEFHAIFEHGYLKFENGNLYKCGELLEDVKDVTYPGEVKGLNIEMSSRFVNEIQYFVDSVINNESPVIATAESTAGGIRLAEKITEKMERVGV